MEGVKVGQAAAHTGWSPRMLRYLERTGLVVPRRTQSGYRAYGLLELNQLRSLSRLRRQFKVELTDIAFAARLRREPDLRAASIPGSPAQKSLHSTGNNESTSVCSSPN